MLHAKVNLKRAERGQPPLSLRRLADESGVSLSVVAAALAFAAFRLWWAPQSRTGESG